jgi:hypothetical protein
MGGSVVLGKEPCLRRFHIEGVQDGVRVHARVKRAIPNPRDVIRES